MAIHCRTIDDKPGWRKLTKAYSFTTSEAITILVPNGYEWNGASTPWFAKMIIPKFEKTLAPSCIHDYLCEHAKTKEDRKFADDVFLEMLRRKNKKTGKPRMGKIRSRLGWLGVRIGAFFSINGSKRSWK
jgi:hypothetical protein